MSCVSPSQIVTNIPAVYNLRFPEGVAHLIASIDGLVNLQYPLMPPFSCFQMFQSYGSQMQIWALAPGFIFMISLVLSLLWTLLASCCRGHALALQPSLGQAEGNVQVGASRKTHWREALSKSVLRVVRFEVSPPRT